MDLVIDQMVQFEHVYIAHRHLAIELVTRPAIEQLEESWCHLQGRYIYLLVDLLRACDLQGVPWLDRDTRHRQLLRYRWKR